MINFEKKKEQAEPDVSGIMIEKESVSRVMNLIEELGETCKKILVMFYYEELSMKEILDRLDYENEQVVRNKKYKCLKQMEQMLAGQSQLAKNLKSILFYE